METIYMLNEMIEEVETEILDYEDRLHDLRVSRTIFNRHSKEIAVLNAKIDVLMKFERKLRMELRRHKNFREIEA
jgi:hypothetical protein